MHSIFGRNPSGRLARAACVLATSVIAATAAGAQAPGLPVLQSAFYSRGFAIGVNGASGGGTTAAAAVSYAPLTGRLVVVAGGGLLHSNGKSETTGGFRAAFRLRNFGAERQIAVGIFAGAGTTFKRETRIGRAPFGVSFGYRRALGETRALAVYAAPYYDATRATFADSTVKQARFRSGIGADVALTPSIGAGLGIDVGGKGAEGTVLAAPTQIGFGLSYHF